MKPLHQRSSRSFRKTIYASIAGTLLFGAFDTLAAVPQGGDPVKGREVAEASCKDCHVVERTRVDRIYREMETGGAPDFLAIALDPKTNAEGLAKFLLLTHGSNVVIAREDIPDVVSYILTLRPLPKKAAPQRSSGL